MAIDYTTPLGTARLLLSDTDEAEPIWPDEQLERFLVLAAQEPFTAAALALEAAAANDALTMKVVRMRDMQTNGVASAQALRELAASYRVQAASSGGGEEAYGFAVAEHSLEPWGAVERLENELERGGY